MVDDELPVILVVHWIFNQFLACFSVLVTLVLSWQLTSWRSFFGGDPLFEAFCKVGEKRAFGLCFGWICVRLIFWWTLVSHVRALGYITLDLMILKWCHTTSPQQAFFLGRENFQKRHDFRLMNYFNNSRRSQLDSSCFLFLFTKKRRGWTPAPKRHGNTTKMTGKLLTTWKSSDQKKKTSKINVPGDADKPLKHRSHSSLWILDWLSVKWYIFVYKTWKSSNNIYIWFPYISCTVQGGP